MNRGAVLRRLTLWLTVPALGGALADSSYTVQAGDTLSSLAQKSGSTVRQLQQLNTLSGDMLRVGQVLQLPNGADTAVQTPTIYQTGMAVYYPGRSDARTVLTAAHLSLPFGTWVEVVHSKTGRSVLVMINDRGPFGRPERVIDLSQAAAQALGILGEGVAPVTLRIARAP
jgi:rare lipoprotein A